MGEFIIQGTPNNVREALEESLVPGSTDTDREAASTNSAGTSTSSDDEGSCHLRGVSVAPEEERSHRQLSNLVDRRLRSSELIASEQDPRRTRVRVDRQVVGDTSVIVGELDLERATSLRSQTVLIETDADRRHLNAM